MADLGRISCSASVLLRDVLKIIGTDKLNLRQFIQDALFETQAEVETIVADVVQFLSGLECILHQGLPQEKLVALRRCVEKIEIDRPDGTVRLTVRSVPVGSLEGTVERKVSL